MTSAAIAGGGPRSVNLQAILSPGAVIGERYEIRDMLGLGGMGAVYRAHDRELDRIIALKVIRPDLARNPEVLQRFKQELLTAREVTHRNVVRIFDIGEANGVKFITMEFVAGRDLRSILADTGKLPPDEALDIMQQACAGLAAAHDRGIIHRDLKPGNIMREEQGRVVVMDFGLARSLDSDGMTQTGAMLGTMEYMSPEQAKAAKLDARSDLFTAGLIFFELLTGKMPYKADSAVASLLKRTQERAVSAADIDASVPKPVSELVAKCLERDPAQRFQSAHEIIQRIDELRGRRPASVITVVQPAAKRWMYVAATAVVLLVAVAATLFFTRRAGPATAQAHKPVTVLLADFQNQTGEEIFDGTLEPAFGLALEGAPFISTYNRTQARKIANQIKAGAPLDDADSHLVAVREGISVVIGGAVKKQGDGYAVTSTATDAVTGKSIGSAEVTANDKSSVLKAVGSLAGKLRTALGDTTPESIKLAEQETYTSASLEAAHEYARAQELRYQGKTEDAIQGFLKTIQLDPNFGSAYGNLAALYWNQGNQVESVKYYQQAMAHIDRMSEREKYRTRGGYYLAIKDGDKAVDEFSQLVKQFPADNMGLSALAFAYYLKHDMTNSMQAAHRAGEIYPKNAVYKNNAALYALYAADYNNAEKEAGAVLQLNPDYDKAYVTIELAEIGKGDYDKATATLQKLATVSPIGASYAANGLADMALYRSDPASAIPVLEKSIAANLAAKNTAGAAKQYVLVAEAQLMIGKKADALASVAKALATDKASVLFRAAHLYAAAGEEAKAAPLAAELAKDVDVEPQALGKLIEGELQLNRGHAKEAITAFQESKRLDDRWLAHFDLARAYLGAGAFPEANSELDVCLRRRGETTDIFTDEEATFRFFPATFYYLGRVLEGMKSSGAADAYRKFLALKAANAQDPMVKDARARAGAPGA